MEWVEQVSSCSIYGIYNDTVGKYPGNFGHLRAYLCLCEFTTHGLAGLGKTSIVM